MRRVMPFPAVPALCAFLLQPAGCGAPGTVANQSFTSWEGTSVREGATLTVRTTSGSVWGGDGLLIEETAIGTETRGEFDVLGRVMAVDAAEEEIFILDRHDSTVRVYDWLGNHQRNIGRRGQGPGEMGHTTDMGIDLARRHLIVRESLGSILHTFTLEGEFLRRSPPVAGIAESGEELQLRVTRSGTILSRTKVVRFGREIEGGYKEEVFLFVMDSMGVLTDSLDLPILDHQENVLRADPNPRVYRNYPVPFAPQYVWSADFDGSLISGYPEEYSIEIRHPHGGMTVIQRETDPVAVEGGEGRWAERRTWGIMGNEEAGWKWDGPGIPETKAWYTHLVPDRSGRLWVLREGRGHPTGDDGEPDDLKGWEQHAAWVSDFWFDVFEEASGRYLGRVKVPEGFLPDPEPFIMDDVFICLTEDGLGRPIVRRYRLELPNTESEAAQG